MTNPIKKTINCLLIFLFLGALAYQINGVISNYAHLAVNKVWNNRKLDAISRSADAAYGSEFLNYINFLRKEIPTAAIVVDSKTFGEPQYDLFDFMQYFLFPRQVQPLTDLSCQGLTSINQCIKQLLRNNNYVIYGNNYLPDRSIYEEFLVNPFNNSMGVIKPSRADK